jgi:starvation-inducible DNA-binding protein
MFKDMKYQTYIALAESKAQAMSDQLQTVLATYAVFLANIKGYHWLVQGQSFFEVHEMLGEFYSEVSDDVDEIAERILTLGYVPLTHYSDYLKQSKVSEAPHDRDQSTVIQDVLKDTQITIELLMQSRTIADEQGDKETEDQLISYLRDLQKRVWMLTAFLGTHGE